MSADDLTNRTPTPDDTETNSTPAETGDTRQDDRPGELQHEREQRSVEMPALAADPPIEDADDHGDEPTPPKPETPPAPDTAPRVVSEAPFGGVAPSRPAPPPAEPDSGAPAAEPPVEPPSPAETTVPSDAEAAALSDLVQRRLNAGGDQAVDQIENTPSELGQIKLEFPTNEPTNHGKQARIDAQDPVQPAAASGETETAPPASEPSAAETSADAAPDTAAAPPASGEADRISDAGAWDDSISPELAAVLFNQSAPAQQPAPAAEAPSTDHQPAALSPADTAPDTAPPARAEAPPAAPIQLTDIAQARTLPITAEGHRAPAPDTALDAKVRYVRVEEPIKDDNDQRIEENWTYFKASFPGLEGRLVRKVSSEELQYADGSWAWTYERRYDDGGRDRREVRANADRTYFERTDEVSVLEGETGKRLHYEEEAALILAAPEREEKRGGILGGLFGREKDDEATAAARTWRDATGSESRQARREGGAAFDRGFLSGLFS